MIKNSIRTFIVYVGCLCVSLSAYAQKAAEPVFYKHSFSDAAILYGLSNNGKWALAKAGNSDAASSPKLIEVETGKIIEVLSEEFAGTACDITDVTDDGEIVVGSIAGRPAYWRKTPLTEGDFADQEWILLDVKENWNGGYVNAVTPDGKYGVGVCTGFYGTHEDSDVPESYEFDIAPCLWDLSTGKIIETPNLPTRDMIHLDQHQNEFCGISPDGRYILGRMDFSYVMPPALFTYVYDRETEEYEAIGFEDNPIDDWKPKAEGLLFTNFPAMSPNGEWVTGHAYMIKPVAGSDFPSEYTVAFRYNVKTKEFNVYDGEEDADVMGVSVDDNGVVYASSPVNNPLRTLFVRYDGYWIDFAQICKQSYGFDFFEKTKYDYTGTPIFINNDGSRIVSMVDPNGESYIADFGEPLVNRCADVDLLGNYTAVPESGVSFSKMRTVKLTFDRDIKVLGAKTSVMLKNSKGEIVRNSISFELDATNKKVLNIAFRTTNLEAGEKYTVEIPAGSFALNADETKVNKLITLNYTGLEDKPMMPIEVSPANGSVVAVIDNVANPIILTFENDVYLTDTASAYLYRDDIGAPVAKLVVAYNGNKVGIYPSAEQYLYEGFDYTVVVMDSAVVDAAGNCGNNRIVLKYKGSYVREVLHGSLFNDAFDNISQSLFMWMRYEGDHNKPMSQMQALEFDADNQPWNFSIRESDEVANYCMASHSMYAPSGSSDDWAVTPQIVIPDERCYLEFDAQSYYFAKSDSLTIIVYESEENYGALNAETIAKMKSEGKVVFKERLYPGETEEGLENEWQHFMVSLAEYNGKKIYIAFVNDNYNQSAIFVDNVKIEHNSVYSISLKNDDTVLQMSSIDIAGTMMITAEELTFENVVLTLKDANDNVIDEIKESGLSLAKGDEFKFDFNKELPLVVGEENDYTIVINLDDRVYYLNGSVKSLAFKPVKRVVFEIMTGQGCGNCPLGILAMNEMKRLVGDQVIPINIHTYTGDRLGVGLSDYSDYLGLAAAPSARINRLPGIYSPIWQNTNEDDDDYAMYFFTNKYDKDTWLDIMNGELAEMATTDISIKAGLLTSENRISVPVAVKNAVNVENKNYSLLLVVLEDGIMGTQTNYFSSYTDEIFGDWGKNGKYGKHEVAGYVRNNVARTVIGESFAGTTGLLPSNMTAGTEYTTTIEANIPDNITNWSNASAVVMLIDANTGVVQNSAKAVFEIDPVSIKDVESENPSVIDVKYYGFDGTEHNSPVKGLNIVKTVKSNGDIDVKKVLIK